jgi:hypothetical protein
MLPTERIAYFAITLSYLNRPHLRSRNILTQRLLRACLIHLGYRTRGLEKVGAR